MLDEGVAKSFSKSYICIFRIAPFQVYVEIEVGLSYTTHWGDTNRVMLLLNITQHIVLGSVQTIMINNTFSQFQHIHHIF
jgi:hypothetical protein